MPAEAALVGRPEEGGASSAVIVPVGEAAAVRWKGVEDLADGPGELAASSPLDVFAADPVAAAVVVGGAEDVGAVDAGGSESRDKGEDVGELHLDDKIGWFIQEMERLNVG